ncbi:uncharacterized protein M6B38_104495 [Iris pallida]|uniref:Uncharacterized protein n=1 Tax=Iris pallida TaxID=29817 RepID=A0AAX6F365_IRIPA|nr:uncharacterized protein M6B38_104495 [Iris pallida]
MGIISGQAEPRGTLRILWEGLKLLCKNLALLHPILLLSFLSYSLLFLASNLCLAPLLLDLVAKSSLKDNTDHESPPEYQPATVLKESKQVVLIAIVVLILSFVIKSLVAAGTVHVLSTAHSSKTTPSSKLREVFAGLNWSLIKRCMITQLYVVFGHLGFILMVGLTVRVLFFSYVFMIIFAVVAVLEFYLYLYLLMVANTSMVVSVVEEGCYGLEAIAKASKLVGGRRNQAIRIALVELAVGGFFYGAYMLGMAHVAPVGMARWALGFGQVAVGVVISVLIWSVQTVYYYGCSAGQAEEGIAIAMEAGFQYNPIPTASQ